MITPKKALLVTTVSGFIPQFEMENVRLLQKMGYEVHYASNYNTPSYGDDNHRLDGTGIIRHQIDFVRSPFRLTNLQVYRSLKTLMQKEHFDLVHCHTPMGGVMARLAAHATHTAPVIYTAHGFHFFKGASLVNWLCYYPMEKFLSRFTTQQICINREDYLCAQKHFHSQHVDYIPGAGIDLNRISKLSEQDIQNKKKELHLPHDKYLLLSSGELIKRKNHETIIRAIAQLRQKAGTSESPLPDFHYMICGHGQLEESLKKLVDELHLSDCVTFLGYREDMMDIYQIADVFLFPSYQEGLPMALLEAMASGLPVVCSAIRGNTDLMEAEIPAKTPLMRCKGGILVARADDVSAYARAIYTILSHSSVLSKMGQNNAIRARHFSIENVTSIMESIYQRYQ